MIASLESTFFSGSLGLRVHRRESPGGSERDEDVLMLHGLGDHSGRHDWATGLLHSAGYGVYSFDWPGCGLSEGARGNLPTTAEAMQLIEEIVSMRDTKPVGIFAHSTGAFYALHWLLRNSPGTHSLQWIWLSSSLLAPSHGQNLFRVNAARWLGRYFPTVTLGTGVAPVDCYHGGEQEVTGWDDKLVHDRISLRLGADLLEGERKLRSSIAELPDRPAYLLTHGLEDTICPPGYAMELFRSLGNRRKVMVLAKEARHEPFRERGPHGITNAVRSWLREARQVGARG